MRYISTRDNQASVGSAAAIHLGMVPRGGLFVPERIPRVDPGDLSGLDYRQTAHRVLSPLLTDFTKAELLRAVCGAYSPENFDVDSVVELIPLDAERSILELWHGPTAAFKDVALQIMPSFLSAAKRKVGESSHTVILVATSGDTGKAALEGFKDGEGLSIVVFYPHGGVSEIQRLQMATTEGSNVHVLAVRGNFDDCQTAVKGIFGDRALGEDLSRRGFAFSSANSINWGRLCPQIVYYYHAYLRLLEGGRISRGEPVDFCVPTGNFGNILAAWYARAMGLPVARLICASNRNRVLYDFFREGGYDRNREFHRTMSPSMDILISSNLERFLFEVTGHDAARIEGWYGSLARTGRFSVDPETRAAIDEVIAPGWVDEPRVLATIGETHASTGYVLDTHTAVAVAVSSDLPREGRQLVIDATASPYKFSRDVLRGLGEEEPGDELASIERLREATGLPVHRAVSGLRSKPVRHEGVIGVAEMRDAVAEIVRGIEAGGG
jgi:threonine synthase